MDPVSAREFVYADEEIDLRGIINTLLRYKWLILGISLILAVAGFAFSKLILPRQFQATAMVILTKPIYSTNLDQRIQIAPQLPDAKSLTDLARADDLLFKIIQSPEAAELLKEGETVTTLKSRLEVALVGLNQLRLSVTDIDPERAARLANYWAQEVIGHLNNLFDVDALSLSQIEEQRSAAYQKWTTAEEALLEYLPQDRSDLLAASLEQASLNLQLVLEKINGIELLISDIKGFDARLAGQNQNVPLAIEDALSLITLQQRSVGGENVVQVQANGGDILREGYTVANARTSLKTLADGLASQRQDLEAEQEKLGSTITSLRTELEESKYRLNDLTMKRDLALSAYQALSSQEDETRIALAQNDQVSKLASQAIAPQEDVGPHSVMNAAAAGILGLIFSSASIFALEWWRSSGPAGQKLHR